MEAVPHFRVVTPTSESTWNQTKGCSVTVLTPPRDSCPVDAVCEGPFYQLAGTPEYVVCLHLLELGD